MGNDATNSRDAHAAAGGLGPALAARLLALAAAAWPEECCGLLLGRAPGGAPMAGRRAHGDEAGAPGAALDPGLKADRRDGIVDILPAANVAADPCRRFEIDPAVLIAAHRAERAGGPPVLGHYHSHPAGPAAPSAADRAEARGDGALWAIIACGGAGQGGIGGAPAGSDGDATAADHAGPATTGTSSRDPGAAGSRAPGSNCGGQVRVWRDDPAGFVLFSAPAQG